MAGTGIEREPCPYRIIDDAGGAYAFGLVGGGIWHSVGGFRNAPKGKGLSQAWSRVKARAPILGGSFAIWGTFFSIFDCSIASIRKKEDPWNAIISGAATGGLLALRGGVKAAGMNALAGGVILAAIEGLNIAVQRIVMPMFEKSQQEQAAAAGAPVQIDMLDPPTDPLRRRASLYTPSKSSSSNSYSSSDSESSSLLPLGGGLGGGSSDSYSSSGSSGSGGFDLDSISSFDTMGSGTTSVNGVSDTELAESNSSSTPTSSGSSWFKW